MNIHTTLQDFQKYIPLLGDVNTKTTLAYKATVGYISTDS